MNSQRFLTSLALVTLVVFLAGCADCFDGQHDGCPKPVPIVPPQNGPFDGGGNGM
jgi:hypothetical protein